MAFLLFGDVAFRERNDERCETGPVPAPEADADGLAVDPPTGATSGHEVTAGRRDERRDEKRGADARRNRRAGIRTWGVKRAGGSGLTAPARGRAVTAVP